MSQFNVQGMSCAHCVRAITAALTELDARAHVNVDLATGVVQVEAQLSDERIEQAIAEQGYDVQKA